MPGGFLPFEVWSADAGLGEPVGVAVNLFSESFVARDAPTLHVTKLDALGKSLWTVALPGYAGAIAAFPDTGALVASTQWGVDGAAVVVQALDGQGAVDWSRAIDTPQDDRAEAAAAGTEAIFVGGSTGLDAFVARFDLNGIHRWSKRIATPAEDRIEGLAPLADGGVLAAGWTYDGVRNRALLVRLDEYGGILWQRALSFDRFSARALAAAASPLGDVIVAGVQSNGLRQTPFAAAINLDGKTSWTRLLEHEGGAAASSVAVGLDGSTVLAGTSPGSSGGRDGLLARLGPDGALVWSSRLDEGGDERGVGLAWTQGLLTVATGADDRVRVLRLLDSPLDLP